MAIQGSKGFLFAEIGAIDRASNLVSAVLMLWQRQVPPDGFYSAARAKWWDYEDRGSMLLSLLELKGYGVQPSFETAPVEQGELPLFEM